jgi:hypothetical protein
MTFPAIMEDVEKPIAGLFALIVGIITAWFGGGLFPTAVACSVVVFVLELFI